jgi:hypothetical protein
MKYFKVKILISFLAAFLMLALSWPGFRLTPFAFAHGPVTTQSQVVGPYTVEFEYPSTGNIHANAYTAYSFRLLDKNNLQNNIAFDSVFVQFSKLDADIIENAYLKPFDVGLATMGFAIGQEGTYQAKIDFYLDSSGQNVVKSTFNFQVYPEIDPGTGIAKSDLAARKMLVQEYFWIVIFIIAFGLGVWAQPEMAKLFKKIFHKK